MLGMFRAYRERGWREISPAEYAHCWEQWGGSVITHPRIVERLALLAEIPVRYLGWPASGALQAAIPTWGQHLALAKAVLKRKGKRGLFDLGNAEVILPIAEGAHIDLRFKAENLSERSAAQIKQTQAHPFGLALARAPEDYSKKFRYNQRRELRLLEEAGGQIRDIQQLTPIERATIYSQLFEQRWSFDVPGKQHLSEVFTLLDEFMTGSVLYLAEQPIAIQILYKVQSPQWISVEYVNGGVAPDHKDFSPGSVLSFINTQAEWQLAKAAGKTLRYSFGRDEQAYKQRWCHSSAIYFTR